MAEKRVTVVMNDGGSRQTFGGSRWSVQDDGTLDIFDVDSERIASVSKGAWLIIQHEVAAAPDA